jgi:hypothetical protein
MPFPRAGAAPARRSFEGLWMVSDWENRERRKVFALWLPWWEAELRHLDQFIKMLPLGKFSAWRRR